MAEKIAMSARRRGVVGFAMVTTLILALLVGLGFWQLQRRVEKRALIAALTERLMAAPGALPPAAQWGALTPVGDEFRRVSFSATFEARPDAMAYSSGSAVRTDISGPGTWAFMPAKLPDGDIVVINAGFVQNIMQDRTQQDRAVAPLITGAPLKLTGYLRFPEVPGLLTPRENPERRLWFVRDHLAMAQKLGWDRAGRVAPFYVDLESPVPASGIPSPGPLEVHLRDDHLQYAITWFGLAGAVMVTFGVWLFGQRRARFEP
jgi:surfeit locus 1 family protein